MAKKTKLLADIDLEYVDEHIMNIIDAEDPKYGGKGFWTDSRCDSVHDRDH